MKPIEKDELYEHLSQFLKAKGIEMKEGSYTQRLQKSCGLLTDAINLGQKGIQRAKQEIDKNLDHMRRVIHDKTAPKPPAGPTAAAGSPAQGPAVAPPATPGQSPPRKKHRPSAKRRHPRGHK